ncbi:hypothetical protein LY632_04705 [Erythrobacter sp. SDW2]|uniref:DUF6929 family protein n=1 Tax=Erythrobacter sp. SDW2 TaxID=2907154 RepID=UPI001F3507AB|nr:hypothetical protein [Erythrobacter sp. SDW2]UIP07704.1 hypothetical protein LY632_04705 [Erythrobacter sp. SDW2]
MTEAPLPSGHAFLSAASGMAVVGTRLCVVADDASCLAVFALDNDAPGTLVPLIPDELPRDPAARKRVKPDFEVLVALEQTPGTRLLALGSGSTPQRMRGAIIELPTSGEVPGVHPLDLRPLFAAIDPLVRQVNIEGAVIAGSELLLFNRGNMRAPASQVISVPLADVLSSGQVSAALRAELSLPSLAGVPLTVTDAFRLDSGQILLSAVAEATSDSYADGALAGAAIVELDVELEVLRTHVLQPPLKVEGIAAYPAPGGLRLLCVTDADDPDRVAELYEATLRQ